MNSFLSRPRAAIVPFLLLLATGNSGCSGGADTGSHVAGSGGAGGAGGSGGTGTGPSAACEDLDATDFAELTAPPGKGFGEAALAATDSEVALVYTRWDIEERDVTVFLQRFTIGGAPLGEPALLHTYNVCCGQLAVGDFYGLPSVATDGKRFVTCWGEAFQLGCASVAAGTGEVSFHAVAPKTNSFSFAPHVTAGPAGFRVFYSDPEVSAATVALDEQANPIGDSVSVPAAIAVATPAGWAVASPGTVGVSFLDASLQPLGPAVAPPDAVDGIVALGDAVAVVGGHTVTLIDAGGQVSSVPVASEQGSHRMAAAQREGDVGVAWSSSDEILRFSDVAAGIAAGPQRSVGCAMSAVTPAIAAVSDGFLVAAPRPEGGLEAFYKTVYPRIRVTHVAVP